VLANFRGVAQTDLPQRGRTTMARYILIDNATGYIVGDSAALPGPTFKGSPKECAAAVDEWTGNRGHGSYQEVTRRVLGDDAAGYHVYLAASVGVPIIDDGEDQDTIDAVFRSCDYVTSLRWIIRPVP
jgi:hypothetical protein